MDDNVNVVINKTDSGVTLNDVLDFKSGREYEKAKIAFRNLEQYFEILNVEREAYKAAKRNPASTISGDIIDKFIEWNAIKQTTAEFAHSQLLLELNAAKLDWEGSIEFKRDLDLARQNLTITNATVSK